MSRLQVIQSIQRLACTKCGAETNASCNCGVAYDIAEITARSDSSRQELDEIREKARKKKQNQRSRPGTTSSKSGDWSEKALDESFKNSTNQQMPTAEEADETYQETLFDQACLLLDSMADATRQKFFAYLKDKYHAYES